MEMTRIALLRGINVGGHNRLPMKAFRELLTGLGLTAVKTYIQSGNAVFCCAEGQVATIADDMAAALEQNFGFRPQVQVLSAGQLRDAIDGNPFPEAAAEPKNLHLYFLNGAASPGASDRARDLAGPSEHCELREHVFYLWAPGGIARSRLANRVENVLGVAGTGRNLRSALKILELADTLGP